MTKLKSIFHILFFLVLLPFVCDAQKLYTEEWYKEQYNDYLGNRILDFRRLYNSDPEKAVMLIEWYKKEVVYNRDEPEKNKDYLVLPPAKSLLPSSHVIPGIRISNKNRYPIRKVINDKGNIVINQTSLSSTKSEQLIMFKSINNTPLYIGLNLPPNNKLKVGKYTDVSIEIDTRHSLASKVIIKDKYNNIILASFLQTHVKPIEKTLNQHLSIKQEEVKPEKLLLQTHFTPLLYIVDDKKVVSTIKDSFNKKPIINTFKSQNMCYTLMLNGSSYHLANIENDCSSSNPQYSLSFFLIQDSLLNCE